jgi:CubicO group peptidase (beta-lactamase class C family)
MADSDTITGLVEPGFEAVRDAFAGNFEQGREVGAAFCAHVEGRKVVDLYGGSFDRAGSRPYGPESLQLVFSTTKGATAICANLLAQRGLLDLDAPVSTYWPEFDQAGKGSMPVRYLLSHQAGVPAIDRRLSPEELQAWTPAPRP